MMPAPLTWVLLATAVAYEGAAAAVCLTVAALAEIGLATQRREREG